MSVAFGVATGIVFVCALLGLVRVVTAGDDASRAAASDLIFFCAIATFVLLGSLADFSVLFDVMMIASLVGILATVALARILTRGRR